MSESQEVTPFQNIENEQTEAQKQFHPQHGGVDSHSSWMMREPQFEAFIKNIDIRHLIALCCSHKISSDTIREFDPRINKLYTKFDFDRIYRDTLNTKMIKECVNHFKPQKVILKSSYFNELPTDLFDAFSSFSPKKLIIRILNFNQQFLIHHFEVQEIEIYLSAIRSDQNRSTNALNSILHSANDLNTLKVVGGGFDNITVAILGYLNLKNLTLCNVELKCSEIDIFVGYITKSSSMEVLILYYCKEFQPSLQLFFNQLMNRIHETRLKSLEISICDKFFRIENISLIPYLELVQINIIDGTSLKTLNYIKKITVANPEIDFEIHGCNMLEQYDLETAKILLNKRFQNLANVTYDWFR